MFRPKFIALIIMVVIIASSSPSLFAQRGERKATIQQTEPKAIVADSTKKAPEKGPQTIEKFIKKDAKIMKGLTTVYVQDGKFFISIPDSLFKREILMVTRISKAAAGIRNSFDGYAGDDINSGTFRFEAGPNNKILLRKISGRDRSSDSTKAMYSSVQNSNLQAIVASFDIKAQSEDKKDNLIDVTDFFNSDSESLFFRKAGKTAFKLGGMQKESSYISSIRTYPINTEVKSVKTYTDRPWRDSHL
ncbi:MAG: DUF5117 domain-containing protein [Bacteroidales bacterium]|jgi:hypothetical protein